MPVYNLCIKIIKKNIPTLLIYIIVFLGVSILESSTAANQQKAGNEFISNKSNIAFISEEDSPLIEGLKDELSKVANFIDIPDQKDALQDALFFRRVVYILRVPEGFTQKFMTGEEIYLEKTMLPDSASNAYIDLSVDKYLNTAKIYMEHMDNITQEGLVAYLSANLSEEAAVTVLPAQTNTDLYNIAYSYNYMAYSLSSVLILGMSAIMLAFNNRDLKNRMACSPISETKSNLQFILASLSFAGVTWLIQIIACFILDMNSVMTPNTVFFIINSLVFTVCATSMGFLFGSIVKGSGAISAVTNVVVLGSCFISGVFVPTELLGKTTLKIASFIPTYWFVSANNQIAQLSQFDLSHIKPVISNIAIILCFALAFFSLSLVIRKNKRYS